MNSNRAEAITLCLHLHVHTQSRAHARTSHLSPLLILLHYACQLKVGIFNGTVAIVPSLKAPGFCNAEARAGLGEPKFPDVSEYYKGGIVYKIKSTGAMSVFKAAFGTSLEFDFGSYKADFSVPNSGKFETVHITCSLSLSLIPD